MVSQILMPLGCLNDTAIPSVFTKPKLCYVGQKWGACTLPEVYVTLWHLGNTILLFLLWRNNSFNSFLQSYCLFQGARLGTKTELPPFIPSQLESSLPSKAHLNFLHTNECRQKDTWSTPCLSCPDMNESPLASSSMHKAELEMNDAPFPYLFLNFPSQMSGRNEWGSIPLSIFEFSFTCGGNSSSTLTVLLILRWPQLSYFAQRPSFSFSLW